MAIAAAVGAEPDPAVADVSPGCPSAPAGAARPWSAQRIVDYLSDHRFSVEQVTIVGAGLNLIEQVTGRRGYEQPEPQQPSGQRQ